MERRRERKRHHEHHEHDPHKQRDNSEEEDSKDSTSSENESSDEESSYSEEDIKKRHKSKDKSKLSSKHKTDKLKKRRHSSTSDSKKRKRKRKKSSSKSIKELITEDDYFLKSTEFRTWLAEERGVYFSDLSSDQSRKLFKKFTRRWNNGELKKKYYDGIQSSSLLHSTQTKYKWKLSSGGRDEVKLGSVRDQVSSWTAGDFDEKKTSTKSEGRTGPHPSTSKRLIGPQRPSSHPDPFEEEERREKEREHLKKERKEYRKYHEMVMDELLPKATGHAAKIEKKKARAEQRRERELSPDTNDSILMGSSTHNVQDKLKAQQAEREQRAQAASQKISEYQAKEKARVAAILELAKANKKEGAMW